MNFQPTTIQGSLLTLGIMNQIALAVFLLAGAYAFLSIGRWFNRRP